MEPGSAHWTHRLFVGDPELYLPFLVKAEDRAAAEVDALVDMFGLYRVPARGRVLDVACGIGRHSVHLAQRGYRVTGLDISPLYVQKAIEHAEAAGVEARFAVGDMREVESLLGREIRYDALINMFTSNGYYRRDGDLCIFRQLRRLAAPGAVLVVLTSHRDWMIRNFEPEALDRAGTIGILQERWLDLETSTLRSEWVFFEGEGDNLRHRLKLQMDHRIYSLHEFKGLLEEAGWQYLQGLGSDRGPDMKLEKLTLDSMTMWVVARAE